MSKFYLNRTFPEYLPWAAAVIREARQIQTPIVTVMKKATSPVSSTLRFLTQFCVYATKIEF